MFGIFIQYWWQFVLTAIVCYLFGSVNFSVIFSKSIKKHDIRLDGSGNPGTTNMFRVFGLPMGLLTFFCDALKGVIACLVAGAIFSAVDPESALFARYFAGLFAVAGHIFPAYYHFRGGKGVATSMGALFVIQPWLSLITVVPCIIIILITDRMSVMAVLYSLFMITWHWTMLRTSVGIECCIVLTLNFLLVLFAHRHNLLRLVRGKELPTGVRRALAKKKTDNKSGTAAASAKSDEKQGADKSKKDK